MQLRPTKTLARHIDRFVRKNGIAECARLELTTESIYPGVYCASSDLDYDWETGKYRVIVVYYPYGHNAVAEFLSTPVFNEWLSYAKHDRNTPLTEEEFHEMLIQHLSI